MAKSPPDQGDINIDRPGAPSAAADLAPDPGEGLTNGRRGASRPKRRNNADVRRKLIEAAAKVVGERGYAGASIARITAEAGVAHGAFYLHFDSQQELFDMLLPTFGDDMIDAIGYSVRDATSLKEIEARGLDANVSYLARHPDLLRVLREAEYFAPETYRAFIDALSVRYFGSLKRSRASGQVRGFEEDELKIVADMLMGARHFLLERYTNYEDAREPLPAHVARAYLRFALGGLAFSDRVEIDDKDDPPPG